MALRKYKHSIGITVILKYTHKYVHEYTNRKEYVFVVLFIIMMAMTISTIQTQIITHVSSECYSTRIGCIEQEN